MIVGVPVWTVGAFNALSYKEWKLSVGVDDIKDVDSIPDVTNFLSLCVISQRTICIHSSGLIPGLSG